MKKILLKVVIIISALLTTLLTHAQNVGINATGAAPNSSAMLDVSSTTSGILIPRMAESQRNAIPSPATGLLIYQTNDTTGFYYYTGTAWQLIGGGTGWGLFGNSGTNPGTNFIGTTDANDFVFKTNSNERMRLVNSSGNLVLGSGEGTSAGIGNTLRAPNASGTNIAGTNLTIASGNGTGIGGSGYISIQTAPIATAGSTANTLTEAMRIANTGNIIVGYGEGGVAPIGNILRAPNGSGTNIPGADFTITSGNGTGTGGSGRIIFQTAPANTAGTATDTMVERMRISSIGNVGIGTTNPLSLLHVNGTETIGTPSGGTTPATGILTFNNSGSTNSVSISAGNTTASYSLTLPTAQGAANTVLTNNGSGALTWTTPNSALATSNVTTTTGGVTIVNGTGQVVGGSDLAINIAVNSLSSPGLIPAGSGNNNKAWVTDGSGNPSWRAVDLTSDVSNTLPVANGGTGLTSSTIDGQLLIGNSSGGYTLGALTAGTGISITNGSGNITVTNTGVTSVGLALPCIFTVSGSPVTTTGTLTGALANENANMVFAGPTSGGAAAPTFRALVAADVPAGSVTANNGLTVSAGNNVQLGGTNPLIGNTSIISGGFNLAFTGTGALQLGAGSASTGTLQFFNSTNNKAVGISSGVTTTAYNLTLPLAQGAANTVLTNNGSGTLTWTLPSANLSTLTPGTGLTGSAYNGSAAETFGVSYGSTAGTAVQGNTTLTISPGTGMSGGGTITLGTGGTVTLNNTGVTSVGLALPGIFTVSGSPVTTTGTLTGALANENANMVFAGPTSGGAAAPTFRALVAADVPAGSVTANNGLTVSAGNNVQLGGTNPLIGNTSIISGGFNLAFTGTGALQLGAGSASTGTLQFLNSTNNNAIGISSGATTTAYNLTLPLAQGAANTVLTNNGSGTLTWTLPSANLSTLTPGTGLTGSAYNGSAAETFGVSYGSAAGTAVQGNTTITVSPGTGMSGGGTITLGTGGTVTLNNTGVTSVTASAPLSSSGGTTPNISLTGIVPIANGGTDLSTAPNDGQLLIGNSSSGYTLSTLTAGTGISITNASGSITLNSTGVTTANNGLTINAGNNVQLGGTLIQTTTIAQSNYDLIHNMSGTGNFRVQAAGSDALEVLSATGNVVIGSGDGTATVTGNTLRGPSATGLNNAGSNVTIAAGDGTGIGGSGYIAFQTAAAGASGTTANTMTERMRVATNGNVGIGTTSPNSLLQVNGTETLGTTSSGTTPTTGVLSFNNSSSANSVNISAGNTTAGYLLTLPLAQGAVNTVLTNNGSGTLTWALPSANLSTLTPGTGLTGSAYNGSAAETFGVDYGSAAGTAVQGNTTLTVSPGTGMSGGGTITLGAGGTVTLNNTGVTLVGLALPGIFTVSGSPVTTTGTLTGTLANENANTVFAGPTSGGAATPTFRALVAADIPAGLVTANNGLTVSAGNNVQLGGTNPLIGNTSIISGGYNLAFTGTGALQLGAESASTGTLQFFNSTNNNAVGISSGATTTAYNLTLPLAQGAANTVLTNNGSGTLTWALPSANLSTLTPGTGLTGSAYNGSAAETFGVSYGSTAGTAVQGNTTITVSPGTGMSGGGTITLGTGGTVTLNNTGVTSVTASAPLASSGGTTPNISLTGIVPIANGGTDLSTTPTDGQLLIGNGTNYTLGTLTAGTGMSITNAAGSITLNSTGVTTANNGLTVSAGNVQLGGANALLANTSIISGGFNLSFTGTGAFQLGAASTSTGTLKFYNSGSANAIGISAGATTTAYNLTLPLAQGAANTVLTNNGAGVLSWAAPSTSNTAWQLTGNSGTTPVTNFVGTTDGNDLVFETNSAENMRISNSTGNVVIGSGDGGSPVGNIIRAPYNNSGGNKTGVDFTIAAGAPTGKAASGSIIFQTLAANVGSPGNTSDLSIMAEDMRITSTGALAFNGAANYGTSGSMLQSTGNGIPSWSTATYPTTTTADQILYSSASNTVTGLAVGTNGQVLTMVGGVPAWAAVSGFVTSVTASVPLASSGGTTPNISLTGIVPIANGGTDLSTTPTDGQLLIGNGTNYTLGTLTAGTGMSITNAAGSITLNSTGVTTANNGLTVSAGNVQLGGANALLANTSIISGGFNLSFTGTGAFQLGAASTSTGTLKFYNSGSANAIGISAGATTTAYNLTLPLAQGAANTVLTNNGSGTLTWTLPSANLSTLTPGTGLTGSAYNGSAAETFGVSYGSVAGTAVQGNTTLTITAGTGMSGGGTITLGSGGSVTLNNTGVTSVTASAPLASSGGTTPNISLTGIVPIANGGTGLSTAPADGQLLIGNSSGGYTLGTLTAGTGMSITNASGSITLNSTGVTTANNGLTISAGNNVQLGGANALLANTSIISGGFNLSFTGTGAFQLGSGSASTGTLKFYNSGSANAIGISSGATTTAYNLTLPLAQGAANTVLTDNGSGTLTWAAPVTSATAWQLTGNAGTTPGTNFVGTTDAQDLLFDVDGVEKMRIDEATGNVVVGAGDATGTVAANTLRGPAITGTNQAGVNLTFASGNGTGTGGSGNLIFQTAPVAASGATANTMAERMRIAPTGDVGIGTTTPTYLLHVNGTEALGTVSSTTGTLTFNNSASANSVNISAGNTSTSYSMTLPTAQGAANTVLTNNGAGVLSWATASSNAWQLTGNAGTTPGTNFIGTTDAQDLMFKVDGVEKMRIDEGTGNVVIGAGEGSGAVTANTLRGPDPVGTNIAGVDLTIAGGGGTGNGGGGDVVFQTAPAAASGATANTLAERMRIMYTGNVGIGTANPTTLLQVNGTATLGTGSSTTGTLQFDNSTNANTVSVSAGATSASYSITLPTAAPTANGQILSSTTAGVTSWATEGGTLTGIIVCTSSTSGTIAAGTTWVLVKALGGGGAGGGGESGGGAPCNSDDDIAGGGGGAGGYCEGYITGVTGGTTTYTVTVGAGGTGTNSCTAGNTIEAGNTSVVISGTTLTAKGGWNGATYMVNPNGVSAAVAGGNGGTASGGSINFTGATGGEGVISTSGTNLAGSGSGASSIFGSGGQGLWTRDEDLNGITATSYGAGGGGAASNQSGNVTGGNGDQGVVIIYEYK